MNSPKPLSRIPDCLKICKTRLGVSCESSADDSHETLSLVFMKRQAFFVSYCQRQNLKMSLSGALEALYTIKNK